MRRVPVRGSKPLKRMDLSITGGRPFSSTGVWRLKSANLTSSMKPGVPSFCGSIAGSQKPRRALMQIYVNSAGECLSLVYLQLRRE